MFSFVPIVLMPALALEAMVNFPNLQALQQPLHLTTVGISVVLFLVERRHALQRPHGVLLKDFVTVHLVGQDAGRCRGRHNFATGGVSMLEHM